MTAPLSIIIPVSRDPQVVTCIDQLLREALEIETVVVFNCNPDRGLVAQVLRRPTTCIVTDQCNLAAVRNLGIRSASSDNVLFLDADCSIARRSIDAIVEALQTSTVVRPRLRYGETCRQSRITARVREVTTIDTHVPLLPLAFNRSIVREIGGYYFDERLAWGEDRDFGQRIERANLSVAACPDAEILHKPLRFRDDMRSALNVGYGRHLQVEAALERPRSLWRDALFLGELEKARAVAGKKGLAAAIYHLLGWRVAYKVGYYAARASRVLRERR